MLVLMLIIHISSIFALGIMCNLRGRENSRLRKYINSLEKQNTLVNSINKELIKVSDDLLKIAKEKVA